MTTAVVGERPPSPPISNDGDFALAIVQKHVVGVEKHAPPRSIRPAPIGISSPEMVGNSQAAVLNNERRESPKFLQDLYGDPSMYQTAQNYTYYPVQPVCDLIALKIEEDANVIWADV